MSSIINLFISSFCSAKQVYDAATFKSSLQQENSSTYPPSTKLKDAMQPFLDEVGIRKDLIFFEDLRTKCNAYGTSIFKSSQPVIAIIQGLYEADKDACTWVIKHEISHIKHNDALMTPAISCLCQLAAFTLGMKYRSFFPAVTLALITGIVSQTLFSKWREAKADDFAIKNSSNEELKGGLRYLMAVQKIHSGKMPWNLTHPSFASRIQKIEKALHSRDAVVDPKEENQKTDKLTLFLEEIIRKEILADTISEEEIKELEKIRDAGLMKEVFLLYKTASALKKPISKPRPK
jgi:hypothetical protein